MMKKAKVLWLLTLAVLGPHLAWGQAKVGTAGAQFLELGVSARAAAMGDAFVSLANDATALYYNPAGLTQLSGKQAVFSGVQLPADMQLGFVGFVLPVAKLGGQMGVSVYGLNSGDIEETDYGHPSGTGRTFGVFDLAVALSYARSLTDHFSMGVTAKFIQESFNGVGFRITPSGGQESIDEHSRGWAADVGTLYDTGFRGFRIAMSITNFGPDLKLSSNEFPGEAFKRQAYALPINFKFGTAINVVELPNNRVTLALEGSHPSDNLEKFQGGVEYAWHDILALRAGARARSNVTSEQKSIDAFDRLTFTFGGGVQVPLGQYRLQADYAFQDFGVLDNIHRLSVILSF